jgi:hypothetical protein
MSIEKWQFCEREPPAGGFAATDLLKNGTTTRDVTPFMNICSTFSSVRYVLQIFLERDQLAIIAYTTKLSENTMKACLNVLHDKSKFYQIISYKMKYNLKISVNKTEAMAMKGEMNVRTKITISHHIIEQANSFNYVRYTITETNNRFRNKNGFNQKCNTIRATLNNKRRKEKIQRQHFIKI